MEQRIAEFIAGLRAAGVRISIAESGDAFAATRYMGVLEREAFRISLRTTLVKEAKDLSVFDSFFPLYFGDGGPPLMNALDDLTPEQRQMLAAALRALLEKLKQNQQDNQDNQQNQNQSRQGQPSPMNDSQLAA
jgi:uncharacterized protein with von Willebrand factor type A (vWA) domain